MQGPENYNSRHSGKAGDGREQDSGLRDWQRNTWFGPAPQNENPFDEPEDAPELREYRSENVNEHIGDFWKQQSTGYGYAPVQPGEQTGQTGKNGKPLLQKGGKNKGKSGKKAFLTALVCLIGIVLVLRYAVFSVRQIDVIGNSEVSNEDVIQASGIRTGDNILTLNEKNVAERIGSDYRLLFRYLEKDLPNRVTISVREREACCWVTYCGIFYELDKNRMVLNETENRSQISGELTEVKGLRIQSGCYRGQTMLLSSSEQQLAFHELFLEMKVLSCSADIAEADLSTPSSILLTTRDGYTVALGDGTNIHAKLRSMLLVRAELRRRDLTGGSINVSNPESPLYSPK